MRVLLIEDDPGISSFLTKGFAAEGYQTTAVIGVSAATAALSPAEPDFDVVLLDLGLPDGSGEEVLRALRVRSLSMPVIILTARGRVDDKVRGLDLGANDYITKPFSFEELLARMRAALRSSSQSATNELVVGD